MERKKYLKMQFWVYVHSSSYFIFNAEITEQIFRSFMQ